MSRYSELDVRRQTTADLLDEEGVMIALVRAPAPVQDGAGGWVIPVGGEVVLPAKKRFVCAPAINVRSGNLRQEQDDEAGRRDEVKWILVGPHDDDVLIRDWFSYNGQKMRVVAVYPDQSYETRASVVDYGDEVV